MAEFAADLARRRRWDDQTHFLHRWIVRIASQLLAFALDASGLLLRATFQGEKTLPGHDFTNGWRNLFARGLNVVHATGDHLSIVHDEQHLAALAREINAVLDRYG
jgi:hypothetical protein